MDERMTICNMSIEGGARAGYVNPDQVTFDYLRGRRFAPAGRRLRRARARGGRRMASDPGRARTTTRCEIDAAAIRPTRDVGHQSRGSRSTSTSALPRPARRGRRASGRRSPRRSSSWGSAAAQPIKRHADRRGVRRLVHQRAAVGSARSGAGRPRPSRRAARQALVVPGSQAVRRRPSAKGWTGSSPRPGSSGAAPAARCAWR